MSETEALNNLMKAGYKIEIVNPYAVHFNDKYLVFKESKLIYRGAEFGVEKKAYSVDECGNLKNESN